MEHSPGRRTATYHSVFHANQKLNKNWRLDRIITRNSVESLRARRGCRGIRKNEQLLHCPMGPNEVIRSIGPSHAVASPAFHSTHSATKSGIGYGSSMARPPRVISQGKSWGLQLLFLKKEGETDCGFPDALTNVITRSFDR
jgi:hypothetical protein